ncbi:MAG: ABC transporter substrate-binding protein [Actinomycetota bacterium]
MTSRFGLRTARTLVLLVALALVAAACGGSDEESSSPSASSSASAEASASEMTESDSSSASEMAESDTASASASEPSESATAGEPDGIVIDDSPLDFGRVVALGEDVLLANLLAMGVTPVFSTTNGSEGFVGIDRDTSGIEFAQSFNINPEELSALDADLLITGQSFVDLANAGDIIDGLADEVIILQESGWRERVTEVAEALGVPERAAALLAAYDAAVADAQGALDPDLVVSVASVYDFAFAAWVDAPAAVPATLQDLGVTVSPGGGELANESFGRVRPLSDEQLPVLDGDILLLLQNFELESEAQALAAAEEQPLWQSIPAVAAGNVAQLDRIGYQGVEGRIRLIEDIIAVIEGLS